MVSRLCGGTSIVYRAFDRLLGHDVALKVCPDSPMSDPEERSRREVKAGADGVLDVALAPPNLDVVVWVEVAR